MDHMHNCYHDGNVGHIVTPESLKYSCRLHLNWKKFKQRKMLNHFQLVCRRSNAKVFEFKLQLFIFNKNGNNKFIAYLAWPNDIGYDGKSKQDIKFIL